MGVFQRHTERKKTGVGRWGGVDRQITWLTYIYSPEKGREKASGKASSVQVSAGRQLTFRLMVPRQCSRNQTLSLKLRF